MLKFVVTPPTLEESDGDRRRQREGWLAGKSDVPKPQSIAAAIRGLGESGTLAVGGRANGREGSAGTPE